jgi:uncharacterized repeat protein (TIGR01451 family)
MTFRGSVSTATLGFALLIAGCGGGSGRSGTDLVVTGVGPSAQLNGGDLAVFVMTITNAGQYTADNLSIRNSTIQISQPTLAISCTASGGAVCPSVTGTTMTAPSMPAGASLVFQVSGNTNVGASGTISDIMSVQSDTNEVDANNNTATVNGSVVSNDVSVTGTAPAGPLVDGPATFTMVVTNAGPNTAVNVGLVTTASTNVTVVPAEIVCVPTLGATAPTLQADNITLLSPSIPINGVLTCTVPVTVAQATNGFALVTLTATALGDSRTSNNAGTASVQATLVNDLGVTGSAALVNDLATFTMVVSNAGPSTATSVVITNTLGANLTYAGPITCVSSVGAAPPALQSSTPTVITLLAASIQVGETLTCSVQAAVPLGTNGFVTNRMVLSSTDDPKTANNDSGPIGVSAALTNNVSVVAEAAVGSVPGGGTTTFKFDLSNAGPSTAFNVALTNTLSSNLSFTGPVTCTNNGNSVPPAPFTISGSTATGLAPSILVGETLVCSVPVMVTVGTNGTVASTFVATSAFDTLNLNNTATASTLAASADLGVSQTAPATVAAGSPTTFTATVANPRGGGTATNLRIEWVPTVPPGTSTAFATPTCVATGGALCPDVLGPSMTVPSLLTGASLIFTFVANTNSLDRGVISSTVSVSADGDPNPANNLATTSSSVVDSRNGTYSVFAADGRSYSLSIDFDAASYAMSGNGQTAQRSFAPPVGGDYVVSGNARFRLAQDLIVGGHDFGNGVVLPFVAARSFVTSVAQIAGSYDLATRNVPASGTPTTHAGTALVNGNTLSVCQSDTAQVVVVRNCDPASLKTYSLSVSGNGFTGISGTGETFFFNVANTGAAKLLLSAGPVPDGTSQQFRIGLVDSSGGLTYGPPVLGPSTTGDWVTITLTNANPPTYAARGSTTADSASLTAINSGGPFSMVTGPSATFSASIYVMQASPLVVVVGSSGFGGSTAASGLLQIALP